MGDKVEDVVNLKIKLLYENSVLPVKAHNSDYAYDCVATSKEVLSNGAIKFGLGISVELDTTANMCIKLAARSSIYKTGLSIPNGFGIVDKDYRGELFAIFYPSIKPLRYDSDCNVISAMDSGGVEFTYEVGDRVCQMFVERCVDVNITSTVELSDTNRGTGGLGSTGK